ncbi:hypothetical protein CRYUN_Cryun40dG0063300 [Craigia yunnanensis]
MAMKMKRITTISPFPGKYYFLLSLCQLPRIRIYFISCCPTSAAVVDDKTTRMAIIKSKHFESLIIAKSKSGSLDLQDALFLFDSIIQIRPLPSIYAFNHLLGAVSKMKHYSIAVSMCKQMMACNDIQPDICAMTTLMSCLCNLKKVDLGFSVLAMIVKLRLNPNPLP